MAASVVIVIGRSRFPEVFMRSEVDRYLGWPGQAISYKVGERVWLEARADAKKRKGAAFDLKEFHTFALDWSPNRLVWSVDGNVYQTRTPADLGGRQWVFDHPFFIILNLAVGGSWPGNPDGDTADMVVDYVRVYSDDTSLPEVALQESPVDWKPTVV